MCNACQNDSNNTSTSTSTKNNNQAVTSQLPKAAPSPSIPNSNNTPPNTTGNTNVGTNKQKIVASKTPLKTENAPKSTSSSSINKTTSANKSTNTTVTNAPPAKPKTQPKIKLKPKKPRPCKTASDARFIRMSYSDTSPNESTANEKAILGGQAKLAQAIQKAILRTNKKYASSISKSILETNSFWIESITVLNNMDLFCEETSDGKFDEYKAYVGISIEKEPLINHILQQLDQELSKRAAVQKQYQKNDYKRLLKEQLEKL